MGRPFVSAMTIHAVGLVDVPPAGGVILRNLHGGCHGGVRSSQRVGDWTSKRREGTADEGCVLAGWFDSGLQKIPARLTTNGGHRDRRTGGSETPPLRETGRRTRGGGGEVRGRARASAGPRLHAAWATSAAAWGTSARDRGARDERWDRGWDWIPAGDARLWESFDTVALELRQALTGSEGSYAGGGVVVCRWWCF